MFTVHNHHPSPTGTTFLRNFLFLIELGDESFASFFLSQTLPYLLNGKQPSLQRNHSFRYFLHHLFLYFSAARRMCSFNEPQFVSLFRRKSTFFEQSKQQFFQSKITAANKGVGVVDLCLVSLDLHLQSLWTYSASLDPLKPLRQVDN